MPIQGPQTLTADRDALTRSLKRLESPQLRDHGRFELGAHSFTAGCSPELRESLPSGNVSIQDMQYCKIDTLVLEGAIVLAGQPGRFRDLTKGKGRFEAVEPALPQDIVGVHVFIPA